MAEENTPPNSPADAANPEANASGDEKARAAIEDTIEGTSSPEASDLPTANAPDPTTVGPANPNAAEVTPAANDAEAPAADTQAKPAANHPPKADGEKPAAKRPPKAAEGDGEKPAAKAKKEKPPALEDKPFGEFIQQYYLPALKEGFAKQGIPTVDLVFEKGKINITGFTQEPECWQVVGRWNAGYHQSREFNLYFFDESITGRKGFSYSDTGGRASTLESFRIDERKVDLPSLVFWTLQRLNAQKWLVRN